MKCLCSKGRNESVVSFRIKCLIKRINKYSPEVFKDSVIIKEVKKTGIRKTTTV